MSPAEKHLAGTDPRFAALIAQSLRYNIKPPALTRPFDALAESIAYQQLSGKAAATIWSRVRALYPRRKYLDPKLVLETPDERFREDFRPPKTSHAQTAFGVRRKMAPLSLDRGVVFLARTR